MRIGIFGDSWGCGVWGNHKGPECYERETYGVVHLGIQHYFWKNNSISLRHTTINNFSKPAGSNTLSLECLNTYHQYYDIKIFIVTEPFRDFFINPDLYDSNKTFVQNCEQRVDSQLKEIETLCGETCMVVGGLHKISKNYNFMHTVNWCELIDSSVDWPVYYAQPGHIGQKLKQNEIIINGPKIKEVLLDEEAFDRHYQITRDLWDKYFTRCGHPNKLGHEILYKEIQRVIS